jgi:glycosyltransferase involved in cell wall biosynthesis
MTRLMRESWVLSEVDRAHLTGLGAERVVLVPHGIDMAMLDLARAPAQDPEIVFLGNLSVPHNVDAARFAAREVWPLVRERWPRARLRLVGASPAPAVRSLAALPGVEVTGMIPDLRPVWARAHVMLAALRFSTGIQNKVLEAMVAGVPVVTIPDAATAVGAEPGRHLLVGSDARQLADAVDEVLRAPEAAAERAARARELVRRNFSWDATRERIEALAPAAGRRSERVAPTA